MYVPVTGFELLSCLQLACTLAVVQCGPCQQPAPQTSINI